MYSNDFQQIRNGFINYIGSALKSSPYENEQANRQLVFAMLIEEALKLATNEDNTIDLYTCKPLIRGCINLFKQRIVLMKQIKNVNIDNQIKSYETIINELQNIVDNVNQ